MESEMKFWLLFWLIVGTCFCTLTVSITTYNVINMRQMNDAITHASDPVAMSCAMGLQASCFTVQVRR